MKRIWMLGWWAIMLMFVAGCVKTPGEDIPPQLSLAPGPGVALAAEKTPGSSDASEQINSENDGRVTLAEGFYYTELSDAVKERITGKSYPEEDKDSRLSYDTLRYLRIMHYDFAGNVQEGELVIHKDLAKEVLDIFHELYKAKYPLASVRLVDDFAADDKASTEANNTSGFNYRFVAGTKSRSLHSYGMAIDVNPLFNPYVKGNNVDPDSAAIYADRSKNFPGKIDKEDLCYKLFAEHGWEWGGDWKTVKDYQHFSKEVGK